MSVSREKPLVLQIDDSGFVLTFTKTMLEQLGCEALAAKSGPEGIKLAAEKKPDVILLDATMPDMDGLETAKALRAAPETKDIPIIMATGADRPEDVEKAKEAGVSAYLTKPFKIDGLREKLAPHIKLK